MSKWPVMLVLIPPEELLGNQKPGCLPAISFSLSNFLCGFFKQPSASVQ